MRNLLLRLLGAAPVEGRRARAWYKTSTRWVVGAITDPHTLRTSSARLLAFGMLYTLHRYLVGCVEHNVVPDWRIVSILVAGGIIPLTVRARSTQVGTVPAPVRRIEAVPGEPSAPLPPGTPGEGGPQNAS